MADKALLQVRIDAQVKKSASEVLARFGLTLSDAVRLMLVRVAREQTLPFDPLGPPPMEYRSSRRKSAAAYVPRMQPGPSQGDKMIDDLIKRYNLSI